jgi:hypothetical protein
MNRFGMLLMLCTAFTGLQAQELWDDFDSRRQVDYGFIHGVFIEYIPNSSPDALNESPMVARYLRNPVEVFDVIIANVGQLADISDYISGTKSLRLDVLAPSPGITVQITLEDSLSAGPTNYPTGRRAEFTAVTSAAGVWETLTFSLANEPDLSVPNTGVNRAVLLFNPGTPTPQTWEIDNWFGPERTEIACEPPVDAASVFMDAECEQDLFIEFYHGQLSRRYNPDANAANASSHVLRYDRNVGEMDDIVIGYFPEALQPAGATELVMDVYDVNPPSVYVMALQTAGGADVLVLSDSTLPSEGNQWIQLRYDLSSIAGSSTVERFVMLYKPGQFSVGRTFLDNIKLQGEGVGLNQPAWAAEVLLYPNPVADVLRVHLPSGLSSALLEVFSTDGKAMVPPSPTVAETMQWDTSRWPDGTYWVRLSAGGRSVSRPVVVQH